MLYSHGIYHAQSLNGGLGGPMLKECNMITGGHFTRPL